MLFGPPECPYCPPGCRHWPDGCGGSPEAQERESAALLKTIENIRPGKRERPVLLPTARPIYNRPFWPPGVEIAAQAMDAFADWCSDHPNDCILKQVEEYSDGYKFVRTYVEE